MQHYYQPSTIRIPSFSESPILSFWSLCCNRVDNCSVRNRVGPCKRRRAFMRFLLKGAECYDCTRALLLNVGSQMSPLQPGSVLAFLVYSIQQISVVAACGIFTKTVAANRRRFIEVRAYIRHYVVGAVYRPRFGHLVLLMCTNSSAEKLTTSLATKTLNIYSSTFGNLGRNVWVSVCLSVCL